MPESGRIVGRDGEITAAAELRPIVRGGPPDNVIIYGKTGTGRSPVARHVTDRARRAAESNGVAVGTVYVDCAQHSTQTRVARTVTRSLDKMDEANFDIPRAGIGTNSKPRSPARRRPVATFGSEPPVELGERYGVTTPIEDRVRALTNRYYRGLEVLRTLDEPMTVDEWPPIPDWTSMWFGGGSRVFRNSTVVTAERYPFTARTTSGGRYRGIRSRSEGPV